MKASETKRINRGFSVCLSACALIFGIIFLIIAIIGNLQKIPENYIKIEGTITHIEETLSPTADIDDDNVYEHTVFISYSYNGNEFSNVEYPKYNSSMNINDSVILFVNPNNPTEFKADKSGEFVFIIIGSGIVIASSVVLVHQIKERKKEI